MSRIYDVDQLGNDYAEFPDSKWYIATLKFSFCPNHDRIVTETTAQVKTFEDITIKKRSVFKIPVWPYTDNSKGITETNYRKGEY